MCSESDLKRLVSDGEAYTQTICYMTGEPDDCNSCRNYSCCLVNGTGTVELTKRVYSKETDEFLGEYED